MIRYLIKNTVLELFLLLLIIHRYKYYTNNTLSKSSMKTKPKLYFNHIKKQQLNIMRRKYNGIISLLVDK